ncbi:acyltransferase family protein [Gracilibacillus salinarum]|uniref:Acyltransferase family protein n=1 Tax=Gracilibacillus salinarum TaxID=2932255 RepID=A0ABY4GTW0_9BACI|nr:acyltransferase family protein [Gracilibacillus salinarum]UOQ87122.1 acyltransferase family protein [Gracilibacillus salinarum]
MQREAYFDNAKLLFIFLVVFGHLIQPLKENIELVNVLYQWIYLFHMPIFVLVSGFFAKGIGNKQYIGKLAKRILVPYLLFQAFYFLYFLGIGKDSWDTTLYDPLWGLWFLLSLFSWHLLLIGYKKIKPKYGIPLAFAVGVVAGYISWIGPSFSLSRTLVFFPFFLIGYWLTKDQLFKWQTRAMKIAAVSVLVVVFAICFIEPTVPSEWMFGSKSYQTLEAGIYGGVFRALLYAVSSLMVFAILLLVPRRGFTFTVLGQNTMYVYLLHGIIIQYVREASLLRVDHNLDTIGMGIIAAAIVWFLASKPVVTFTQPIVEGKFNNLQQWWQNRKEQKAYHYQEKTREQYSSAK